MDAAAKLPEVTAGGTRPSCTAGQGAAVVVLKAQQHVCVRTGVAPRANVGVAALAAAATAACTLGAMAIFTAVPVRLGTTSAILAALVVMIAVQCSRPRRVSLWVSLLGREQILLESARATFVNQVVRALVRASAYKGAGRLVVYRISGRRPRPGFVAVGVLTAAAGLGALVLTLYHPSGVQLLGLPY